MHLHVHCTLSLSLSAESSESLYHRPPLRMSRKCMCAGHDHLAWNRPYFSETCRSVDPTRSTGQRDLLKKRKKKKVFEFWENPFLG